MRGTRPSRKGSGGVAGKTAAQETTARRVERAIRKAIVTLELKPGERTCNVEIDGVGHMAMLLNKRVYEIIRAELLDALDVRALKKGSAPGRVLSFEAAPPLPPAPRGRGQRERRQREQEPAAVHEDVRLSCRGGGRVFVI